jgi:hypothetical protein
LEDRAAEAWCLHQSGTRALCLENSPRARAYLIEALRLRESLGDEEGAAVTRHNLDLLGGLGGDHGPDGNGSGGGTGGLVPWLAIVGAIIIVAIMALIGAAALGRGGWSPVSRNESPQGGEHQGGRGDQQQEGGGDQRQGDRVDRQQEGSEVRRQDGGGVQQHSNGGYHHDGRGGPPPAQCADKIDNDKDGYIDLEDFSCSNLADNDETYPLAQCADDIDNDGDDYKDLEDPECSGSQDDDEANASLSPAQSSPP